MDTVKSTISAIVESYYKELLSLSNRMSRIAAATIDLDEERRKRKKEAEIKKLKNEIDYLLNDFEIIHKTHIEEFWYHIGQLVSDKDTIKHIIDVELKEAFKDFQVLATRATYRLKNRASEYLEDFKIFSFEYKKEELENLKRIDPDILYNSWRDQINPLSGEKIDIP